MSESTRRFDLSVLPDTLAIVRLSADAILPPWAKQGAFFSLARASEEVSMVFFARHQLHAAIALLRDAGHRIKESRAAI